MTGHPFLLAQLSDPHLGARWRVDFDPAARLAAAVEAVRALHPDAVLVTGDLTDHATDAEYEQARSLLAFDAPLHVLPGNHDDRDGIGRHFGEPVEYAVDLGPLRLVAIDTTVPDSDAGALDAGQLAWLDGELAAAPDALTVLALHHPPLTTGVPAWDEFALAADDRRALGEVIARHPQVRRIVAGHVHRTIAASLAGCGVLTVPSTYVQMRLDFASQEIELAREEPAGIGVHLVVDGELISHVQPLG